MRCIVRTGSFLDYFLSLAHRTLAVPLYNLRLYVNEEQISAALHILPFVAQRR